MCPEMNEAENRSGIFMTGERGDGNTQLRADHTQKCLVVFTFLVSSVTGIASDKGIDLPI